MPPIFNKALLSCVGWPLNIGALQRHGRYVDLYKEIMALPGIFSVLFLFLCSPTFVYM